MTQNIPPPSERHRESLSKQAAPLVKVQAQGNTRGMNAKYNTRASHVIGTFLEDTQCVQTWHRA